MVGPAAEARARQRRYATSPHNTHCHFGERAGADSDHFTGTNDNCQYTDKRSGANFDLRPLVARRGHIIRGVTPADHDSAHAQQFHAEGHDYDEYKKKNFRSTGSVISRVKLIEFMRVCAHPLRVCVPGACCVPCTRARVHTHVPVPLRIFVHVGVRQV